MPSLTIQAANLEQDGPVIEVRIGIGPIVESVLQKKGETAPDPVQVAAMIDTGAGRTVISEDTIRRLNLKPVGATYIGTPSSISVRSYKYLVRLLFPDNVVVDEIVVLAVPLRGQHIQCLIGRDVLSKCLLIYNGKNNTFTLSF